MVKKRMSKSHTSNLNLEEDSPIEPTEELTDDMLTSSHCLPLSPALRLQPDRLIPPWHTVTGSSKTLDWDEPPKNSTSKALSFLAAVTFDDELRHDTLMSTCPTILAVKANDADLPSFAEAMASDDCDGFCKTMDSEIEELVKWSAWDLVPLSESERLQKKIVGTLWAFRRKRYPDGTLWKLKAQICCRGDQQIVGLDVFETYAPVVSWSIVRLALTTSVAMGWATAQVDYANAFV
jgi:hypothetical protein